MHSQEWGGRRTLFEASDSQNNTLIQPISNLLQPWELEDRILKNYLLTFPDEADVILRTQQKILKQ